MATEVTAGRPAVSWGDWRLGDLADALQVLSRTLGLSVRVVSVSVFAPNQADPMPVIELVVPHRDEVNLFEQMLVESGLSFATVLCDDPSQHFQVFVSDVLVHVSVAG